MNSISKQVGLIILLSIGLEIYGAQEQKSVNGGLAHKKPMTCQRLIEMCSGKTNELKVKFGSLDWTKSNDIAWLDSNIESLIRLKIVNESEISKNLDSALAVHTAGDDASKTISWFRLAKNLIIKYLWNAQSYSEFLEMLTEDLKKAEEKRTKHTQDFKEILKKNKSEHQWVTFLKQLYVQLKPSQAGESAEILLAREQALSLLDQLAKKSNNATNFHAYICSKIQGNPCIMDVIGIEIEILIGYLRYRIAEPIAKIGIQEAAAGALNALRRNDTAALNNLYRDIIQPWHEKMRQAYSDLNNFSEFTKSLNQDANTPEKLQEYKRHDALSNTFFTQVLQAFQQAIGRNDVAAIIDLYFILIDSKQRDLALATILDYIDKTSKLPAFDHEKLVLLGVVFEGTYLAQEVLSLLQRFTQATTLLSRNLYEEYQIAQVNGDLPRFKKIRQDLVDAGFSAELIDLQIDSLQCFSTPVEDCACQSAIAAAGPSNATATSAFTQHKPEIIQDLSAEWNNARQARNVQVLNQLLKLLKEGAIIVDSELGPLDKELASAIVMQLE